MLHRTLVFCLPLVVAMLVGCGGNVASDVAIGDFAFRKLPGDASEIHFALHPGIRNPNSYFEFTTSETEFLAWAAQQPNVERVEKTQFIVYRYADYPGATDDRESLVVDDGYLFEWYNPTDGDQGECIAYDKAKGRAYYWSHTF
ncbi:hypothetical protein [Rhodopirellula sp. MGV]|uniref:hypothetical protein n=1 Tax=Rhodopirellula sp. MGV TaxID=2023130 RepID=UPI000B963A79|nr:hypothetical protein [Rhodopirellula sp. MGV]OYP35202.1 hypothetical protein CGZ80_12450 [Rhodopirellula sp. MGV]PNY37784.1 hypothetical protein C2E31_05850 [Rhodopirellula baltica]